MRKHITVTLHVGNKRARHIRTEAVGQELCLALLCSPKRAEAAREQHTFLPCSPLRFISMPHISKQHANFWSSFNTYIKISVSAFPCVYKSRGTGKGKLFRRPGNSKPARRHYFSHVSENSRCTFDFKVINNADIFQPYLYPYRRTQQNSGLVNEFLSLLLG